MAEDKKSSEGVVSIELSDSEKTAAAVILNIALRDCEPQVEPFTGRRLSSSGLIQEFAKNLNAVFVQLEGRDHDVYEKVYGRTITKPFESGGAIEITNEQKNAFLGEVRREAQNIDRLQPEYAQTLTTLMQKLF
ncbi:hypothetical protein KKH13_03365 [Patescibacteria group bacterium]|nr:hypothetical protein [Patescibacteria group bacterium]